MVSSWQHARLSCWLLKNQQILCRSRGMRVFPRIRRGRHGSPRPTEGRRKPSPQIELTHLSFRLIRLCANMEVIHTSIGLSSVRRKGNARQSNSTTGRPVLLASANRKPSVKVRNATFMGQSMPIAAPRRQRNLCQTPCFDHDAIHTEPTVFHTIYFVYPMCSRECSPDLRLRPAESSSSLYR